MEDLKEEQFTEKRATLIKDHQDSLSHFQDLLEKERLEVSTKHQTEVDEYKSQVESITTDLTDKITVAEATIKELIAKHQATIETLTTEKDALIAAAETRQADREKELQEEIQRLTNAVNEQGIKIMVFPRMQC